MPDLSTVCLPPFPELPVDAAGDLADDHAGDAAAAAAASIDAAPASASSFASVEDSGGGGPLMLPVECRWSGRVRTFDMSGAGGAVACPAARRGGGVGKKPSAVAPSPGPSRTQAPAPGKTLEERVSEWAARKAAAGVPAHHCVLPFFTGAPKAVRISFLKCSR